jgi:hypothetical protein
MMKLFRGMVQAICDEVLHSETITRYDRRDHPSRRRVARGALQGPDPRDHWALRLVRALQGRQAGLVRAGGVEVDPKAGISR